MVDLDFEVVSLPDADPVVEGEQAPDFERPLVTDEFWEDRALSGLTAEEPVLLVFHTMDGAFPSTYTFDALADRGILDRDDVRVVGCSISSPYEHKSFIADREADVALFSDPANGVAERYGVVNDLDGMAGISEPRPAIYLVDRERVVRYAWVSEEWPEFPDYDDLDAALDAL